MKKHLWLEGGQEVAHLCALLRGFGHPRKGTTQIWEASKAHENPTNRDRSRNVDVKVHFLRDLVREGHI